jgi:hypothetical protein
MALDVCEPQVIRALEKAGWRVLEKPFTLRSNTRLVYADFSLQRLANGSAEQIIVVEVKCFTDPGEDLTQFYITKGQYDLYLVAVSLSKLHFPVYLAIPDVAYARLMNDEFIRGVIDQSKMKLVVVDIDKEEVIEWIR